MRLSQLTVVEVFQRGRAKYTEDESQLVVVVATGEEGFSAKHLSEDAADGPNINCFSVLFESHCI